MLIRFPLPPYLTWVRKLLWNLITISFESLEQSNYKLTNRVSLSPGFFAPMMFSNFWIVLSWGDSQRESLGSVHNSFIDDPKQITMNFMHNRFYKTTFSFLRIITKVNLPKIVPSPRVCLLSLMVVAVPISTHKITMIPAWQLVWVVLCTRSVSEYLCAFLWQVRKPRQFYCWSKLRALCSTDQDHCWVIGPNLTLECWVLAKLWRTFEGTNWFQVRLTRNGTTEVLDGWVCLNRPQEVWGPNLMNLPSCEETFKISQEQSIDSPKHQARLTIGVNFRGSSTGPRDWLLVA